MADDNYLAWRYGPELGGQVSCDFLFGMKDISDSFVLSSRCPVYAKNCIVTKLGRKEMDVYD